VFSYRGNGKTEAKPLIHGQARNLLDQWFLTFFPSRPPKVIFLWLTPLYFE